MISRSSDVKAADFSPPVLVTQIGYQDHFIEFGSVQVFSAEEDDYHHRRVSENNRCGVDIPLVTCFRSPVDVGGAFAEVIFNGSTLKA